MTQTPIHAPLSIPVHRVGADQAFHFNIQPFIDTVASHAITLVSPQLPWLKVSPTGEVSGISPPTDVLLQFWISLNIGPADAPIHTGFLLQIVPLLYPTFIIPHKPVPRLHPLDPNLPHEHDLLDYIFNYFDIYAKEDWTKLLREEAKKRGKVLSDVITVYEFKELITSINPLAEKQLRDKCQALQALTLAELDSDQMINLFRQGSQPLGMTPILVFNYLAAPDLYNFSHVKNVLDYAADELIELMEQNQTQYNLHVKPKPP